MSTPGVLHAMSEPCVDGMEIMPNSRLNKCKGSHYTILLTRLVLSIVLLYVQEGREIKVLAEELAALESKFRRRQPHGRHAPAGGLDCAHRWRPRQVGACSCVLLALKRMSCSSAELTQAAAQLLLRDYGSGAHT